MTPGCCASPLLIASPLGLLGVVPLGFLSAVVVGGLGVSAWLVGRRRWGCFVVGLLRVGGFLSLRVEVVRGAVRSGDVWVAGVPGVWAEGVGCASGRAVAGCGGVERFGWPGWLGDADCPSSSG